MQTTPKEQLLAKIRADAELLGRFLTGSATAADTLTIQQWLGLRRRDYYEGYEQALRAAADGIARRIEG